MSGLHVVSMLSHIFFRFVAGPRASPFALLLSAGAVLSLSLQQQRTMTSLSESLSPPRSARKEAALHRKPRFIHWRHVSRTATVACAARAKPARALAYNSPLVITDLASPSHGQWAVGQ